VEVDIRNRKAYEKSYGLLKVSQARETILKLFRMKLLTATTTTITAGTCSSAGSLGMLNVVAMI
jgi:hypothetical protein